MEVGTSDCFHCLASLVDAEKIFWSDAQKFSSNKGGDTCPNEKVYTVVYTYILRFLKNVAQENQLIRMAKKHCSGGDY